MKDGAGNYGPHGTTTRACATVDVAVTASTASVVRSNSLTRFNQRLNIHLTHILYKLIGTLTSWMDAAQLPVLCYLRPSADRSTRLQSRKWEIADTSPLNCANRRH